MFWVILSQGLNLWQPIKSWGDWFFVLMFDIGFLEDTRKPVQSRVLIGNMYIAAGLQCCSRVHWVSWLVDSNPNRGQKDINIQVIQVCSKGFWVWFFRLFWVEFARSFSHSPDTDCWLVTLKWPKVRMCVYCSPLSTYPDSAPPSSFIIWLFFPHVFPSSVVKGLEDIIVLCFLCFYKRNSFMTPDCTVHLIMS